VPAGPERALEGKEIYERHCARCHGIDGKGVASTPGARDLSNRAYMAQRSDDQLRGSIMGGVPPAMPSFGGQFLEPSMKVLVAYIRGFSTTAGQESAAASSKEPSNGTAP
jgi:mono/diheme cytochrome c family protein